MAQVNRFPRGYLDLLGAQTQGTTPPVASEILIPTLNMEDFYSADMLSGLRANIVHGGIINHIFTVPPTEVWIVRGGGFATFATLVTNFEAWRVQVGRLPRRSQATITANVSNSVIWQSKRADVQVAGQQLSDAFLCPAPFVLLPGSTVAFNMTERDAGGNRTVELSLLATVLSTA